MLEHHIQKSIAQKLAFSEVGLRFSELQPAGVENKLFNYHLKQIIRDGLAEKSDDGHYSLTQEGRRIGMRMFERELLLNSTQSILFLIIRNEKHEWLFAKRLVHPFIGLTGLMHAVPTSASDISTTAAAEVKRKTNLDCTFTVQGGGYFRVFDGDALESYTHFTLLVCENAEGVLDVTHKNAEYEWLSDPGLLDADAIPTVPHLISMYESGTSFIDVKIDT